MQPGWARLLCTAALVFPSSSAVEKLVVGMAQRLPWAVPVRDVAVLGVVAFAGVAWLAAGPLAALAERLQRSERRTWLGVVLATALVFALFQLVYPYATSGAFGGGSDRDEALDIALGALLDGRYPYYERTFVPGLPHRLGLDGNPLSPLPGELFLSLPFFVVFGTSVHQVFFWMLLTGWLLMSGRDTSRTVLLSFGWFFLSPGALYEIASGGDLVVNAAWMLSAFLLVSRRLTLGALCLLGFGFGVALSSRWHFLFLGPPFVRVCADLHGKRAAAWVAGLAVAGFAVVTLPFFLYDPLGFSPLHAHAKLASFEGRVPFVGWSIPALAGAASVWLALRLRCESPRTWLLVSIVPLAIPVVAATLLDSLSLGRLSFANYAWYGLSWQGLAAAGGAAVWAGERRRRG